jgi:hypothetical protein
MATRTRLPSRLAKKNPHAGPMSSANQPAAIRASRAAVRAVRRSISGASSVLSITALTASRTTSQVGALTSARGSGADRLRLVCRMTRSYSRVIADQQCRASRAV